MLATFVLCSSFHIGPVARAPSSRVPATCWMNAKGEPNADKLDPKNNLVDPSLRPELPTGTAFDPAQPLGLSPFMGMPHTAHNEEAFKKKARPGEGKGAVTLGGWPPVKGSLEERVETARLAHSMAVEQRTAEIVQPDLALFCADDIDAEELTRRKAGARERAIEEAATLGALDQAYTKYAAMAKAQQEAEAAAAAAGAELEAILLRLEEEMYR